MAVLLLGGPGGPGRAMCARGTRCTRSRVLLRLRALLVSNGRHALQVCGPLRRTHQVLRCKANFT
eukprot:4120145-Pyramimonas_sp.AAC.1